MNIILKSFIVEVDTQKKKNFKFYDKVKVISKILIFIECLLIDLYKLMLTLIALFI